MTRIDMTDLERKKLSELGKTKTTTLWQPWSTVPENEYVLISFYWKKGKPWYEEGEKWDIGIGLTDDRNGRYVDLIHLDLEDFDAVWMPLPAPYRGGGINELATD
jgi:hypothetical protein